MQTQRGRRGNKGFWRLENRKATQIDGRYKNVKTCSDGSEVILLINIVLVTILKTFFEGFISWHPFDMETFCG